MATTEITGIAATTINLSQLLLRLSKIILSPGEENALLRKSGLERKRVGANLDYARTLLLELEQQSLAIKAPNRRQALQADLADRKDLLTKLNERLYQLNENLEDGEAEPLDAQDAEYEDLLGDGDKEEEEAAAVAGAGAAAVSTVDYSNAEPIAASTLKATLEKRRPFSADREELLHGSGSTNGAPSTRPRAASNAATDVGVSTSSKPDPALPDTEKLLDYNRSEQEDLTASLLAMAKALKASSQDFSSSLESEKEILNRASEGLDKNTTGMESTGQRMGTLRRMTEGRGWIGRMIMYLWVAGLMMLALFIVGFLPKLRF